MVAAVEDKGGELEEEYDGDAEGELVLLCFVVEHTHGQYCGGASADEGEEDKYGFRHSPTVVMGFPFVDAVDDEGCNVDNQEINNQKLIVHIHLKFSRPAASSKWYLTMPRSILV